MALISNIGAGIFTTLKYAADSATGVVIPTDSSTHQSFYNIGAVMGGLSAGDTSITIDGQLDTHLPIPATGSISVGTGTSKVTIAYTAYSTNVFTVAALTAAQATAFADDATVSLEPVNVGGMREFPSFGAPANIVNVPVYGQLTSDQIGGQSDAPTLEFTVNYIPSVHASLQSLVESGATQVFQIRLANAEAATADDAVFYIKGTVSSFLVSPNLTDSNQATISLATFGNYEGPFAS